MTRATRSILMILAALWTLRVAPAEAQQLRAAQSPCAECHNNVDASKTRVLSHAKNITCLTCHHVGLSNERGTIEARRIEVCRSCHQTLQPTHTAVQGKTVACSQCHDVHNDKPVRVAGLPSARCQSCHERPHALHANAGARGPQCSSCHALHNPQPLRATDAALSRKCASCHENVHPSHASNPPACTTCHKLDANAVSPAALTTAQLGAVCSNCHKYRTPGHAARQGAPGCTDCHNYAHDARLPEAGVTISQRCGTCHKDAMKAYRAGGHAQGLAEHNANRDLPNCVSCHNVHNTNNAVMQDIRISATTRCVQCHSSAKLVAKYKLPANVGASYTDDFHGATLQFQSAHATLKGRQNVLTCSDCHGAHNVATRDKAAIAQVCQRCHVKGSVKLASAWLGHAPPSRSNLIVVWLIRLFYTVLIPFTLVGLTLHIIFQIIDQRRKGVRMAETDGMKRLRARLKGEPLPPTHTVTRFSKLERLEHIGALTTFLTLVITGLPQTRPDWRIARDLIELFGGIGSTRFIHRTAGFIFVALLVRHVAHAILRALRTHRMPVMATNVQDFRDAFETVKHFLFGTPRPKTGKFDFSEKFEYWGLFMGGTLMSVTGVALVFPELLTHVLPGVIVAAFRVAHGLEATFAVLVIALWHSYGVVLRPEVFPLDTSIFTGEISVHRLKEEHGGEYERLFPEEAEAGEEEELVAAVSSSER